MATTIPPQVPPPQPPPPGPQPTVTVNNPPPALTQLSLGARIEGVIAGRVDAGQVQIQTSLGTLSVQTNFSLPQNAEVILQVLSLVPNVRLRIASVGGNVATQGGRSQPSALAAGTSAAMGSATGSQAGSEAGTAPGTPAPGAALSAPATVGSPFANLSIGATLSATLLGMPQGPSAMPSGQPLVSTAVSAPTVPAGQTTPQQAPGVTPPSTAPPTSATAAAAGPGTTPGTTPGTPRTTAGAAPQHPTGGAPGEAAGAAVRASTPSPTGSQFDVRIVAIQPAPPVVQSPPPAANLGLAAGTTLTATVTGMTTSGQLIVHTPSGVLALAARSSLPIGTIVTLEIASDPVPPRTPPPTADMGLRQVLASRSWPALTEVMAALQEVDAAQAQHLVNTIIPRPDSQLAANILLFLVALRGGDVRAWLGEGPGRALQRSKPGVLSRLGDEFAQLSRAREESLSGNWQMSLIPLFNGSDIDQVRLFMRRHGEAEEDEEDGGAEGGVRFIIDLELDRLGRLQFDGLVQGKDKRFDLILRSAGDLPRHVSHDIRQIFEDACELTGIKGEIVFQSGPSEFVEITPEAMAENIRGLVV